MFERCIERTRAVVALVQEEAGRLRHDYAGTDDPLLVSEPATFRR